MTDNKNVCLCVNKKNKKQGQVIHGTATMKNKMKKENSGEGPN